MRHLFPESPFASPSPPANEGASARKSLLGRTGEQLRQRVRKEEGRVRGVADEGVSNADILSIDAEALDKRALIDKYLSRAESIALSIPNIHTRMTACITLLRAMRQLHRSRYQIQERLLRDLEELQEEDERLRKANSSILVEQETIEKIPMALLEDDNLDPGLFEELKAAVYRFSPDVGPSLRAGVMLWEARHGIVISPKERKQLEKSIREPSAASRVLMYHQLAKVCRQQGESPAEYISKAENTVADERRNNSEAGALRYAALQQDFGRYQSVLTQVDKLVYPGTKRAMLNSFIVNKAIPHDLREQGVKRLILLNAQGTPSVDDQVCVARVEAELGMRSDVRVEEQLAHMVGGSEFPSIRIEKYAVLAATQAARGESPDHILALVKAECARARSTEKLTIVLFAAQLLLGLGLNTDAFTDDLKEYVKHAPKEDVRIVHVARVLSAIYAKTQPAACEPYFDLFYAQLEEKGEGFAPKWSWLVEDMVQAGLGLYHELHQSL